MLRTVYCYVALVALASCLWLWRLDTLCVAAILAFHLVSNVIVLFPDCCSCCDNSRRSL